MTRCRTTRALTLVALALVAVGGTACGQAIGKGNRHHSPAATPTPAQIVQNIESGLSGGGIVNVTLAPAPPEYAKQVSTPWMYIQVTHAADGAAGVEPVWEADMLAASYSVTASSDGAVPESGVYVASSSTCAASPAGSSCDGFGGPVNLISPGATKPVPFNPTGASTTTLTSTLESALTQAGLTVSKITFDTVDGNPAPIIVARSSDPAALMAKNPTDTSLFGAEPNGFEGIYLEVDDSSGNPALIRAFASRIGAGIGWTRPDLQTSATNPA